MSVVLIGTVDDGVAVVGLYESEAMAKRAVLDGDVPFGPHYAVFTPDENHWVASRTLSPSPFQHENPMQK